MTDRASPTRRERSIAAVIAVVALVGVFLWLVILDDGEGKDERSEKATEAIDSGLALQAKGDLVGAYAKYGQALEHDSDNKFALYNLAVVDYLQSNPGLAEQRYREVLEIDPEFQPALYNLAIVELSLGNERYALSLYQKAVQLNPGDANAHFNLALMLRAMGYTSDGNAQMKIALELNPSLVDPGVPKGTESPDKPPKPGATPTG